MGELVTTTWGPVRDAANREKARLEALFRSAEGALAPLVALVADLRDIDIDASLEIGKPGFGAKTVLAVLQVPAFHSVSGGAVEWSGADLSLERYDLAVESSGAVDVELHVPTPEEDPEAYDLGERPDTLWTSEVPVDGMEEFADGIRQLAVKREFDRSISP